MSPWAISIWDEVTSLDEVMTALSGSPFQQSLLLETGKALILQKQLETYNIPSRTDEESAKNLLTAFCQTRKIPSEQALNDWLRQHKMTPETLLQKLIHADRLEQLKKLLISDQEVNDLFLSRKPRLDNILFSLIRVSSQAVAQELYYRIKDDGHDFAALARQYSSGPEASNGGIVGPRALNDLNPELRACLSALKPGDLTGPFTLDGKIYLIAHLIRKDSATLTPELTANLRNELFEQWCELQVSQANLRWVQPEGTLEVGMPAEKPALKNAKGNQAS